LAAPAGTVDFTLFDNGTCNGQILAVDAGKPLSNGIAVSVGFAATSGAFSYRAHYNGQAGVYPAHDGPCEPFSASAQPGRIVVRKVPEPTPDPSNTSFNFTAAGGLSPGGFSLANGQTRTFDNLTPQSGYSLTEGATTGWQLTSATCDDASPITNIALSPGETVTCTFTNTRLSNGHSISGHIWRNSNGNPLGSAEIQACPDPPDTACRSTSSGADGSYRFDNLPDHTNGAADHHWTLTVNPPGGLGLGSGTLGPILLSGTDLTGQDLILASATVIPDGASITTPSGGILTSGIAVTLYGDPITLRIHGCAPGAGTALLRLPLGYTQSVALVSDGPGTYVAIFAAPSPFDGTGSISWTLDCGTTGGFDIYIDPSGVVRTVSGDPVAGATVTLYRSDLAAGPFVQVPNLSAIMSPGNQANPDTTDATGHFGWDVLAGYYKVRAQKAGCTAPGSGAPFVESDVLTIPPAVIDLDLRLDCRSAPGAPTGVTATPGNGSATLAWSAPASDGGAPVTFYDVTRYVGGVAQGTITVPPNTAFTMTGLANGTTYTFKVAARNAIGTGPQSVESNAVTPRRVPDPPTNVTATAGNGEATVSWSAPAFNGGSAITGYVLTRYVAGAVQGTTTVGVATQATVTGLANGSSYTFFVAAVNAAGTGSSSAPSNPVTPAAPKFTLVVARSGTGGGTVTSSVGGINCGTTCSVDLSAGTSVTLTAVPTAGSTFAGWSGACSGVGSCSVTMDADRNTTAIFNAVLTPAAAPCVVPNVKRKPLATAKRRIGTAHCRTGRVTRARSRTVPKGSVISQSPKAGKKLAPGSKVNLVVSRGKR
jgi:hypothetical protein